MRKKASRHFQAKRALFEALEPRQFRDGGLTDGVVWLHVHGDYEEMEYGIGASVLDDWGSASITDTHSHADMYMSYSPGGDPYLAKASSKGWDDSGNLQISSSVEIDPISEAFQQGSAQGSADADIDGSTFSTASQSGNIEIFSGAQSEDTDWLSGGDVWLDPNEYYDASQSASGSVATTCDSDLMQIYVSGNSNGRTGFHLNGNTAKNRGSTSAVSADFGGLGRGYADNSTVTAEGGSGINFSDFGPGSHLGASATNGGEFQGTATATAMAGTGVVSSTSNYVHAGTVGGDVNSTAYASVLMESQSFQGTSHFEASASGSDPSNVSASTGLFNWGGGTIGQIGGSLNSSSASASGYLDNGIALNQDWIEGSVQASSSNGSNSGAFRGNNSNATFQVTANPATLDSTWSINGAGSSSMDNMSSSKTHYIRFNSDLSTAIGSSGANDMSASVQNSGTQAAAITASGSHSTGTQAGGTTTLDLYAGGAGQIVDIHTTSSSAQSETSGMADLHNETATSDSTSGTVSSQTQVNSGLISSASTDAHVTSGKIQDGRYYLDQVAVNALGTVNAADGARGSINLNANAGQASLTANGVVDTNEGAAVGDAVGSVDILGSAVPSSSTSTMDTLAQTLSNGARAYAYSSSTTETTANVTTIGTSEEDKSTTIQLPSIDVHASMSSTEPGTGYAHATLDMTVIYDGDGDGVFGSAGDTWLFSASVSIDANSGGVSTNASYEWSSLLSTSSGSTGAEISYAGGSITLSGVGNLGTTNATQVLIHTEIVCDTTNADGLAGAQYSFAG